MQKKNYKKNKSSIINNTIKVIFIVAVLCVLLFFALNSSLFNIKHIKVNSNTIKDNLIIKDSKIKKNHNIFKVKTKTIEENLKKNPYIKAVKIKRAIPNTIEIEVLEREKRFLLQYSSIYLLVAEDGVILEHLKSNNVKLPVVKGFNIDSIKIGGSIFKNDGNKELDTFINESLDLQILSKMNDIDKDFTNELNIKLKNGISVAFGTLSNVKYKLGLLKDIIDDIDKREIQNGRVIMNTGNHPILIIDD